MLLLVLDGFGYREQHNHNAIAAAKMPVWHDLWTNYPHTLLEASGHAVGLPYGQMGNSEVGHLTMGAGRTVYQDFTRIEQAIDEGTFFSNKVLIGAIEKAKRHNKAVHIMGLLSPGGVHSHEDHIHAAIELASILDQQKLYVHAFLDGRDTPPQSAMTSLQSLDKELQQLAHGKIASIVGRYYAMDRDKRWERIQAAYDLLTLGKTDYHAENAEQALQMAYARGETDEFVKPTTMNDFVPIEDGDVVIFINYRADRARQLTRAFIDPGFNFFTRQVVPKLAEFVSLTEYAKDINTSIAFPPQTLEDVLGDYVAKQGLTQLRIAETEKYAHVTFFFNGGIERLSKGEERILVPSAKVATYDLQPEMSAPEVTEKLVEAIKQQQFDLIICNFANPDMIGHTGDFAATVKALEVIDACLGKIVSALQEVNGEMIITADHGNAECMFDEKTNQPHTAHTSDPVPMIYMGRSAQISRENGTLADIAPTILYLMNLSKPSAMTGQSLVVLK